MRSKHHLLVWLAWAIRLLSIGGLAAFAQNVGIGTNNPLSRLDVRGPVWIGTNRSGTTPPAQLNFNSDGAGVEINFMPNLYNKWIDVDATNFDITNIEVAGFTTVMRFAVNHTAQSGFLWRTWDGSGYTSRMWLRGSDGYLGIGTTNPQARLHISTAPSSNITPALRLQNPTNPGTFGPVSIEFWSDAQGATTEWRPGYIASGDNGNFTGRIDFYTNGSGAGAKTGSVHAMSIVNGNVGIGTTTPVHRLDVAGQARARSVITITAMNDSEGGQLTLAGIGDYTATGENCNSWSVDARLYNDGTNNLSRYRVFRGSASCDNGLDVISALWNGNVGILVGFPLAPLDVRKPFGFSPGNGGNSDGPTTAIIVGGGPNNDRRNDWPNGWGGGLSTWDIVGASTFFTNYPQRSDRRWKQDIQPITDEAIRARFMQLQPVSYRIDPKAGICDDPDRLRFGFVANDIESLFPNLVINAGLPDSIARGLEYNGFIPLLVSMVQAHEREVQKLREENRLLRERLAALEERISALELPTSAK